PCRRRRPRPGVRPPRLACDGGGRGHRPRRGGLARLAPAPGDSRIAERRRLSRQFGAAASPAVEKESVEGRRSYWPTGQGWDLALRMNAPTAGECGRPRTVTSMMVRMISG